MSEELNPSQDHLKEMEEKIEVYQKNLYFLFSYLSMNVRTPLNSVIGFSRVLLKTPLNQDQQEYTESIHKSGLHLLEKNNEMLDFLGIILGKRELFESVVDLHEIVNRAITKGKEIGARYSSTTVPVTLVIGSEIPHRVICDGERVQQVLINLVSNAVRFTKAGKIIVSVSAEQKDQPDDNGYDLTISVKDSGIGIDTRDLKRMQLFFSQDPAITTLSEMGLTVSKYLSDLLGGRLWVESEIEQGSTFYFKFSCQTNGSDNSK